MRSFPVDPRHALVAGLLVLPVLLAPGAAAAESATLRFTSPDPVRVNGTLAATVHAGGSAFASGWTAGDASFANLTGELRVWEWSEPHARTPLVASSTRLAPATVTRVPVDGAQVHWSFGDEWHRFVVKPLGDGRVTASGATTSAGHPSFLARDAPHGPREGPTPPGKAEEVQWSWRAGWPFVANARVLDAHLEGWPAWSAPAITGDGRVLFHLFGGNVTLMHANGSRDVIRLGNWTEDADTARVGPTVVTPTFHARRLVFEGRVDAFTVDAREDWGVGGPVLEWALDGRATWSRATGNADHAGTRAFRDAVVDGAGAITWTARATGPAPTVLWPVEYTARGEWEWLTVDATPVMTARATTAAAAVVATSALVATLGALAFESPRAVALRFVLPLYSRIAPGDLLTHPRRRRIHARVKEEPGLHLRELHRRVGGGWGGFRAHLRLLVDGGYVRVVKRGGYALAFPATIRPGVTRPLSSIPHPVQRALFDAVPADGSAAPVPELAAAARVSRQLARYHLRKLMRDGFLVDATGPDRRVWVRRASALVEDAAAPARAVSVTEA